MAITSTAGTTLFIVAYYIFGRDHEAKLLKKLHQENAEVIEESDDLPKRPMQYAGYLGNFSMSRL